MKTARLLEGTEVATGAASEQSVEGAPCIDSYFRAFRPAPPWEHIPAWPPDVFALTNLVLDHTEAYRFVVAPPTIRQWPPAPDWTDRVMLAARRWAAACGEHGGDLPQLVDRCWNVLTRSRAVPLSEVRSGDAWDVCEALLTLHALADEACAGLAAVHGAPPNLSFEARAWTLLEQQGSLAHLSPVRVRVVPKTHFAGRGISIRSLSRYLALCYESVDVRWKRVWSESRAARVPAGERHYTIVLVPWPLAVRGGDFHPVASSRVNVNPAVFGFFEFVPKPSIDVAYVGSLLDAARAEVGKVDAVILPEAALEPEEVTILETALVEHGVTFLIAGVRDRPSAAVFGRNYLHFGVHTSKGWERYEQDKHNRWCLDGNQIRQYHLTRWLDPAKVWWEAVDIRPRTLHVIDMGGGATTAPLVCEDLARTDEVADLMRRIGPSVVVAVLLDGPQLTSRWPSRYAGVLADEPGSAVLTLTCLGMAERSRPPGSHPSRTVALWRSNSDGVREIELGRGADAIAITISIGKKTVWTADGRSHRDVPDLMLSRIHQLHASTMRAQRAS